MFKNLGRGTAYSIALVALFVLTSASASAEPETLADQPSVSRRTVVCDAWRWIGHGATTWGCMYTPREAFVAGGSVTDEVITSLQKQINALEERIKKLENK